MKKYLYCLIVIGGINSFSIAQSINGSLISDDVLLGLDTVDNFVGNTESDKITLHQSEHLSQMNKTVLGNESVIGFTFCDEQTYGSMGNQILLNNDNTIEAVWTYQPSSSRSNYFATHVHYNGSNWVGNPRQAISTSRLFVPNIGVLTNKDKIVVSTPFDAFTPIINRKSSGSSSWIQDTLPSNLNTIPVSYSKMCTGGRDGMTIHVLGLAYIHRGSLPVLMYYRSLDGGKSWDIKDKTFESIDSNHYKLGFPLYNYALRSKGDIVAFCYFNPIGDAIIYKSVDNGVNWTKTIVNDFPIDGYSLDMGIPNHLIKRKHNSPPNSVFTTSGSADLIIDNNGSIHAVFGGYYFLDTILTDNNFYFAGCDMGLYYWNEQFGPDSSKLLTKLPDLNDNNKIDIDCEKDDYGNYINNPGPINWPTLSVDNENRIFCAFASTAETDSFINSSLKLHYSHIFIIYTTDNGDTWSKPYDVINRDLIAIPNLLKNIEASFPQLTQRTDDKIHLMYLRDFLPGTFLGGNHNALENNMIYMEFPKEVLFRPTVIAEYEDAAIINLSPNPTNSFLRLELPSKSNFQNYSIYDIQGRVIMGGELSLSENVFNIDVKFLHPGMYLLKLINEQKGRNDKEFKFVKYE